MDRRSTSAVGSVAVQADPRRAQAGRRRKAADGAGELLAAVVALLVRTATFVGSAAASFLARSRLARIAAAVMLALAVCFGADLALNAGKAYPGVHVGEIDAGGKTEAEIAQAVADLYGSRLSSGSAVVYASEEARDRIADEAAAAQDAATAEQMAVEEARANKQAWTATADELGASVPAEELAAEALAVGREDGGAFARLGALLTGRTLDPRASYDQAAVESLGSDIDAAIGEARVDFDVQVENGQASVVEGHDGSMVNRETLQRELDRAFLESADGHGSFVACAEHAPLRIDRDAAQAVADDVNRAIGAGARFSYADETWEAAPADLGAWISTRVEERDGGFALVPYVDEERAKPSLLAHAEQAGDREPVHVSFESSDDGVTVRTDGDESVPLAAEAVQELDRALFGSDGANGEDASGDADGANKGDASEEANAVGEGARPEIAIATGAAPAEMSFDEALDLGVIGAVSSFTTEFTTGEGTENRNHNIELVSELLSDSVVGPGESWSFNDTAGECDEEHGFLDAGAIVDGEYVDASGGGICQVATTVFNAVYDAGYPVLSRRNHSLYIASYPAGRDAAVSWPDLDFVWENDGASDVLVRVSCEEGSVTATLYGVDPGYQVSTETGEWSEGETYSTKTVVDDDLAPGSSYVKVLGTDGSQITVVRTVTDETGALLREDSFLSVYDPVTEVVVKGPDADDGSAGDGQAADPSA